MKPAQTTSSVAPTASAVQRGATRTSTVPNQCANCRAAAWRLYDTSSATLTQLNSKQHGASLSSPVSSLQRKSAKALFLFVHCVCFFLGSAQTRQRALPSGHLRWCESLMTHSRCRPKSSKIEDFAGAAIRRESPKKGNYAYYSLWFTRF